MEYNYLARVVVDAQLSIDDPGNCVVLGRRDDGLEYYLVIRTSLGQTQMLEYGPCTPDINELPKSVEYNYQQIEFSESKIDKKIDKFLNNPYHQITYAEVVELDDIAKRLKNMIDYIEPFDQVEDSEYDK